MIFAVSSAPDAMFKGFIAFGIFAFLGATFIWRGILNKIIDYQGHSNGSRWWWIIGGTLLQVPLLSFTIFAYRQGYFHS